VDAIDFVNMSDRIISRVKRTSWLRPGDTISSKHNYLKHSASRSIQEKGIEWKRENGECKGYKLHHSLYKREKSKPKSVPIRRKKASQLLKRPTYCKGEKPNQWSRTENTGPDWIITPKPKPPPEEEAEDSAGNTVSADFNAKIDAFVRHGKSPGYMKYGKIFNWARLRSYDEEIQSIWKPLKVSRIHIGVIRRLPDVITPITDPYVNRLDEVREMLDRHGVRLHPDPLERTILAIPPLEIEGDQVAIYIKERPCLKFLSGFIPTLRKIAIERAIEQYFNEVLANTQGGSMMKPKKGYGWSDTFSRVQAGSA